MRKKFQKAILTFLSSRKGKKVLTVEVRKEIFPLGKITNPKDSRGKIQSAILALREKNKVEIVDSNSYVYVTTTEIKKYLKRRKIVTACEIFGIEKVLKKFFFSEHVFVKLK